MAERLWNIADLADAAGITTRAVRFYVQQRLLSPPRGVGRGDHYDDSHLSALRRISELQQAGHSLAEIRLILEGKATPDPKAPEPPPDRPMAMAAGLYTRLQLAPGIELHFDASRFSPPVEGLMNIRRLVRVVFGIGKSSNPEGIDP